MNDKMRRDKINHMYDDISRDEPQQKRILHDDDDGDDDNSSITDLLKSTIFDYINNSDTINQLVIKRNYNGIVQDIITKCFDKVKNIAVENGVSHNTALCVLATVILHYTLTKALIKSQRKVTYNSTELDIVIPNIKTLQHNPSQSLIIYVAINDDMEKICTTLYEIAKILPKHSQNIWLIVSNDIKCAQCDMLLDSVRKFQINKEDCEFATIFSEIALFLKNTSQKNQTNNLSILGI